MKRMVCPACNKPLIVPNRRLKKNLVCPTCKKGLKFDGFGLAIAEKVIGTQALPAFRPKAALVAITSPIRESKHVHAELGPVVPSPLPELPARPRWFAAIPVVSVLVLAVAGLVAGALFLSAGPESEFDDAASLTLVNPLDPFGRKRLSQRVSPLANDAAATGKTQPESAPGLPSGQTKIPAEIPSTKSDNKPMRLMQPRPQKEGGDPIQAVLRSVAVVAIPERGHGSGFVAAPGILVTNYHVIEDAVIRDLQVSFPDNDAVTGRPLRAELIHLSIPDDLAFLEIDADVQPLRIKAQGDHINGQRVVAVGSPGSGGDGPTLENLTTDGRLGPELSFDDHGKRWALSMAVNGGNSGGPLVDAQTGEVMGVIVAKFTQTEAQSLAIPHASLVRELAKAGQVSEDERQAASSLHRQRFCLSRMGQILDVTSFAFDRSIAAALSSSDAGAASMNAAFNESKAKAATVFAEQFADFSGTVGGEVEVLLGDPRCDPRVRRGLRKLLEDIEKQAADMRRRVPHDEIEDFLGRFRGSVKGSRDLLLSLAKQLHMQGNGGNNDF